MKILRQFLTSMFALVILLLLGFGVYFIVVYLIRFFRGVDSTVATGAIAAFATIFVSVLSILVSKYLERKAIIVQELRNKKVPIYEKIIGLIFRITFGEKLGKQITEKELLSTMAEITQDLVIWGSPEVIKSYFEFRKSVMQLNPKEVDPKIMFSIEDVFRAIRKDLGHNDKYIAKGTILGIYINDIHKYM